MEFIIMLIVMLLFGAGSQIKDNISDSSRNRKYKQSKPTPKISTPPNSWASDMPNSFVSQDLEWKETRNRVLSRDNYQCVSCGGKSKLTVDHITPRHLGGKDIDSNLQTLCLSCHENKHGRHIFDEDSANDHIHHKNYKVQKILGAISRNTTISIQYIDIKGNVTNREVRPMTLFEEHGLDYLRAYCLLRNDERTFRLSRMTIL